MRVFDSWNWSPEEGGVLLQVTNRRFPPPARLSLPLNPWEPVWSQESDLVLWFNASLGVLRASRLRIHEDAEVEFKWLPQEWKLPSAGPWKWLRTRTRLGFHQEATRQFCVVRIRASAGKRRNLDVDFESQWPGKLESIVAVDEQRWLWVSMEGHLILAWSADCRFNLSFISRSSFDVCPAIRVPCLDSGEALNQVKNLGEGRFQWNQHGHQEATVFTLPFLQKHQPWSALVDCCLQQLHVIMEEETYTKFMLGLLQVVRCRSSCDDEDWNIFVEHAWSLVLDQQHTETFMRSDGDGAEKETVEDARSTFLASSTAQRWAKQRYLRHLSAFAEEKESTSDSMMLVDNHATKKTDWHHVLSKACTHSNNVRGSMDTGLLFAVLHLVYESCKLSVLTLNWTERMAPFLYQLAKMLGLQREQSLLLSEHPRLLSEHVFVNMDVSMNMGEYRPIRNFSECFVYMLEHGRRPDWPVIVSAEELLGPTLTTSTATPPSSSKTMASKLMDLYELIGKGLHARHENSQALDPKQRARPAHCVVLAMTQMGLTRQDLDLLPLGVVFPLRCMLDSCRAYPCMDWPQAAFELIEREDLVRLSDPCPPPWTETGSSEVDIVSSKKPSISEEELYTAIVEGRDPEQEATKERGGNRLLSSQAYADMFPNDLRLEDVERALQTRRAVKLNVSDALLQQHDQDVQAARQSFLVQTASRTLSKPLGRALFDYKTVSVNLAKKVDMPEINLSGRAGPTTVLLEKTSIPQESLEWSQFHNGVACGLSLEDHDGIDGSWIVYNRGDQSKDAASPSPSTQCEHAGFLFGMGLSGHLKKLSRYQLFEYLNNKHELTSVGLLLGISASYFGTMDAMVTKLLSIHIPALLPPHSADLNLSSVMQTTSMIGMGLLYSGSMDHRMVDMALTEIGRKELMVSDANSVYRDGYVLSCGFSLGFIALEAYRSSNTPFLQHILCELRRYIVGGAEKTSSVPITYVANTNVREMQSNRFREGGGVNTDITAPAASIALALIYLRSMDDTAASLVRIPQTRPEFQRLRPDILMVQTICYHLIKWKNIHPSVEWVESQCSPVLQNFSVFRKSRTTTSEDFLHQSYFAVVTGSCFALALCFAGSLERRALDVILSYFDLFSNKKLFDASSYSGKMLRRLVKQCIDALMISASLIMAGSGDLDVYKKMRLMIARTGHDIHYGNHLAVNMAIGILFMGHGFYTLKTDGVAIASLLCSCFPIFPTSSSDHRTHFQPLRHLWVLAAQRRRLSTRDIDTSKAVNVKFQFDIIENGSEKQLILETPCMIPEVAKIKRVTLLDPNYWPLILHDSDLMLRNFVNPKSGIPLKRRKGIMAIERGADAVFHEFFSDHSNHGLGTGWRSLWKSIPPTRAFKPLARWKNRAAHLHLSIEECLYTDRSLSHIIMLLQLFDDRLHSPPNPCLAMDTLLLKVFCHQVLPMIYRDRLLSAIVDGLYVMQHQLYSSLQSHNIEQYFLHPEQPINDSTFQFYRILNRWPSPPDVAEWRSTQMQDSLDRHTLESTLLCKYPHFHLIDIDKLFCNE